MSFRREKYVPKGGPDGGDGGDGGSVFLEVDAQFSTLMDFTGHRHWTARPGQPGMGSNCTGKRGSDEIVRIPAGTVVRDRSTGAILKDMVAGSDRLCVVRGGRGGRGNARFATPTHQSPREFDRGGDGEERWLKLELKLIADVGVIGLPNAGKSTLLSRVSRARPKIASYAFTTLVPNLGIVSLSGYRRFTMADVPGLLEGAHAGVGLGDAFLRHIERTRVVLHLVDLFPPDGQPDPATAYRTIRRELERYGGSLSEKPELIVANKLDLVGHEEPAELGAFAEAIGAEVTGISAVSGWGLEGLMNCVWGMLEEEAGGGDRVVESSAARMGARRA